jgi:hypothetical protein
MSLPIIDTRVKTSGPLPINVAPLTGGPILSFSTWAPFLKAAEYVARRLYEELSCARGDMENWICPQED